MSLPLVVVANSVEKKKASRLFKNHQIKVVGEGFYQVLTNLKSINKKQPIINFGFVGSDDFKVGQIVEVGSSKLYVANCLIKYKTFKLSNSGVVCYTANNFVLSNDTKDKKCIFDMELYYMLALGYNVVKSIKVVSDNLNYKKYHQYQSRKK